MLRRNTETLARITKTSLQLVLLMWFIVVNCTTAIAQQEEAAVVTVTSTNDSGPGSYRQALNQANARPGTTIAFNIPRDDANFNEGVFTITLKGVVPAIRASNTFIDGSTQIKATGDTNHGAPVIRLAREVVPGEGEVFPEGVTIIDASDCRIHNLIISGPFGYGIIISGSKATRNRVTGCLVGTDSTGFGATAIARGVRIQRGAHHNFIGGAAPADRNVIMGTTSGVELFGVGTTENVVAGNYVGLDRNGTALLADPNLLADALPINIREGAIKNLVGGTTPEARNVVAGKGFADIVVGDKGTDANIIQGNYIGTDKDATGVLGSTKVGVFITGEADGTIVGGTVAGAGNVIAGRTTAAVHTTFSNNSIIQGNIIGLDATGTKPLGKSTYQVFLYESSGTLIGGAGPEARNIIAGNMQTGITMMTEGARPEPPHGNKVQGNFVGFIGFDVTGPVPVTSALTGISIVGGGRNNIIGIGLDGEGDGNVIVVHKTGIGEVPRAVLVPQEDANSSGNVIRGNTTYSVGGVGLLVGMNGGGGPSITAATFAEDKVNVAGALQSTPDTNFIIDIYGNTTPDDGRKISRELYLGSINVTTDAAGAAEFAFSGTAPDTLASVKATVTNAQTGGTSNFGNARRIITDGAVPAVAPPSPVAPPVIPPVPPPVAPPVAPPPVAPPPVAVAPVPSPKPVRQPVVVNAGEIRLDGIVSVVDVDARMLVIDVISFTLPNGKTSKLAVPKPKTIRITAETILQSNRQDASKPMMSDLKSGTAISVIGADAGSGKDLTARLILTDTK